MREVTQREFAKRLRTAVRLRGASWGWLGEQFGGMPADSINRWGRAGALKQPPPFHVRRRLEVVLELPKGYLDAEAELDGPGATRTAIGPQAGGRAATDGAGGGLGDVRGKSPDEVRARIEELLEVYRRRGETIEPQLVVFWLAEFEAACLASIRDASGGASAGAGPGEAGRAATPPAAGRRAPGRRHSGGHR